MNEKTKKKGEPSFRQWGPVKMQTAEGMGWTVMQREVQRGSPEPSAPQGMSGPLSCGTGGNAVAWEE